LQRLLPSVASAEALEAFAEFDSIRALQDGEDRRLNELMDRHREGLFRFVLRHVPNETDALELTMETFVRAYFNIGKFRPRAKFATWLYQIKLNLCRDHLRSRAYQYSLQTVSFDAPTEDNKDPGLLLARNPRPDESTDRREELTALEKERGQRLHPSKFLLLLRKYSSSKPSCS
jgi:RNA polymerase sigma factor (sigma-70 family)